MNAAAPSDRRAKARALARVSGSKTLANMSSRTSPGDGWARGEREGYGEPCDVTSLSLSLGEREGYGGPCDLTSLSLKSPERRPTLVIALE